jgi:class 3 adenylate cyclase/predicted ATPase
VDLRSLLRSIGLEQYEATLRENDIDFAILPDLTDDHLRELGFPLGARLKLLKAAAAVNANASDYDARTSAAAADTSPAPLTTAPAPQETAGERRYITVLFCDLVGSTAISAQLDAEDWRDVVGGYIEAASAAVAEMGGRVTRKLGDGLLALFGYPVGQENDAERAVRAALSIQRALAELNRRNAAAGKPELKARIGLDAGPVVVDAAGGIFGEVPNVAARVEAIAEPGTVLITARVQRQIAGLFVAEERGSHTLKGVPAPVTLYRIVRASGGGRRSGRRHFTPLIGRDEEMAMLLRRWDRARQGDGQFVLIVGEPGLGKSRLLEEFRARLRETTHTWAEWTCLQLLQSTPLHPIAEWGRTRFGGADVPGDRRLAELESSLAQVRLNPAENVPLLAPLLDIPLPEQRKPNLAPAELRRRQLAALTNWAIASARVQPLVLAFEDLHWADPTTLDVLHGIAERGALAPLFAVATTRPEFRPPWSMHSHHGTVSLAPLDRRQVRDMVAQLSAQQALLREVVEDVVTRTGGVPLFIEEVTRLLLERGPQGGMQEIPPTLQQLLTARLDRLGPAREVAQIGAVVGRDFSYALIRAVANMEDAALQAALERLAQADILLVQGLPPESVYRFKHALIQDAAYENLLKSRRQALHRSVAEALRGNLAATAAAEPELLAHHFTQAGLTEAAIEWWGQAGQRSLERSALVEAAEQLTRALVQIATLPGTPALRRQQIKLQVSLMTPLVHVKGYAAPETKAAAERARLLIEQAEALGEPPEDPLLLFVVLYGFWAANYIAFNGDIVRDLGAQFFAMVKKQATIAPQMIGYRLMGTSLLSTGEIAEARAHFDKGIALYDPTEHRTLATRFGVDVRVSILSYRSWALWMLGYPEAALADAEAALSDAREIGQAATLMFALNYTSLPHIFRGDYAKAKAVVDELVVLADEKGTLIWKASGLSLQGILLALSGKPAEAIPMIISGRSMYESTGATLGLSWRSPHLSAAYAELGQFDDAWRCVNEAITAVEATKETWCEAESHRVAGEIALKSPEANVPNAQAHFERALAVARAQQAKSWELRAAMSMARLLRDQGKRDEARDQLAPVYGRFTEGFDTLDLKDAKALLDELNA